MPCPSRADALAPHLVDEIEIAGREFRRVGAEASAPFPSALIYWGDRSKRFARACADVARDLRAGAWADVHTAAFLAACAGNHLDVGEMISLTRAMIDVGERLSWPGSAEVPFQP